MERIDQFWALGDDIVAQGLAEEGTMMGKRCLRSHGEFFAMPEYRGGGLVVKLPADRVAQLVDEGVGASFGPGGKVFREWVLVAEYDERIWSGLMREAREFVSV